MSCESRRARFSIGACDAFREPEKPAAGRARDQGRFIQYGAQRWRRARAPRPASLPTLTSSPRPPAAAQAGREGARRARARPITPARRAARPCSRRLSAPAARRGPSPSARSASRASTSTPQSPGAPRFRRLITSRRRRSFSGSDADHALASPSAGSSPPSTRATSTSGTMRSRCARRRRRPSAAAARPPINLILL